MAEIAASCVQPFSSCILVPVESGRLHKLCDLKRSHDDTCQLCCMSGWVSGLAIGVEGVTLCSSFYASDRVEEAWRTAFCRRSNPWFEGQ
eukprot:2521424-Amphidinium_carterae.1